MAFSSDSLDYVYMPSDTHPSINTSSTLTIQGGSATISGSISAAALGYSQITKEEQHKIIMKELDKAIAEGRYEECDENSIYAYLFADKSGTVRLGMGNTKILESGKFYCFTESSYVNCYCYDAIKRILRSSNNLYYKTSSHKVKDLYADPNFKVLKLKVLKDHITYIGSDYISAIEFYVVEEVAASTSISFKVVNVYNPMSSNNSDFAIDVEVTNDFTQKSAIISIRNTTPDITKEVLIDKVQQKIDEHIKICDTLLIEGELL